MSYDDKVFLAIERLLGSNIVSVNEEAKKFCFKKLDGSLGTVDKAFLNDRINAGLYGGKEFSNRPR